MKDFVFDNYAESIFKGTDFQWFWKCFRFFHLYVFEAN